MRMCNAFYMMLISRDIIRETLNDSIDNTRNLKKTFSKGKPDK